MIIKWQLQYYMCQHWHTDTRYIHLDTSCSEMKEMDLASQTGKGTTNTVWKKALTHSEPVIITQSFQMTLEEEQSTTEESLIRFSLSNGAHNPQLSFHQTGFARLYAYFLLNDKMRDITNEGVSDQKIGVFPKSCTWHLSCHQHLSNVH